MSFDEDGFLSEEVKLYWPELERKYSKYFQFAHSLNRMANIHKSSYACNNQDRRKVIANCLFLKILNGFQSCIILLKHSLPFEAAALSRTLCDPMYLLRIFYCDHEFWRKYLKYHTHDLLKKINAAKANPHPVFEFTKSFATGKVISDLKHKIANFNDREFRVEELSKKAGMLAHYDTMFRDTSNEVHTPPDVIFRYARFDENDDAQYFDWGPSDKHFDRIIISTSDVLLKAIAFTDDIHGIPHTTELIKLLDEWKELDLQTE